MKSNLTRILAMLLALLMVVSAIAMTACSDPTPDDGEKDPTANPGDDPEDPAEQRLPIDYLPDKTYDGVTINVLEWTASASGSWVPWEEIHVEVRDGDPIDEAIYDRNHQVMERFGVEITCEYANVDANNYLKIIENNHKGGDDAYQMTTLRTLNISTLCLQGYMANMFELDYLDTSMPWWNQDSVRSYTMGDALYFAAPEMLLRDKGATAAMFYNHTVASDAQIEDLYAVAEDGEWTMEYMAELSEDIAADMDGDDVISSSEDMYGLYGGPVDMSYFLYAGAGMKFAQIDDDGYLELAFDEDSILVWQDIFDEVIYADYHYSYSRDKALIPEGFNVFMSDKALFMMVMVKDVRGLRNMKSDYGVLPIPKYDEDQEDYSSLVWMHYDSVLGIPTGVAEKEATSVALEYMSYLSYYDVYPVFYDTIILGQSARDQQSKEMLELIFRTRVFDPGQYWLEPQLHRHNGFMGIFENEKKNISSLWATLESAAQTGVEEFNEKIDEIGS